MPNTLKSIVQFVNIAPGGIETLPHGLVINGYPVVPSELKFSNSAFSLLACTDTTVQVRNDNTVLDSLDVLCEHYHSIEEEFGIEGVTTLPITPFVTGAYGNHLIVNAMSGWIDPVADPYNCIVNDPAEAANNLPKFQAATNAGPVFLPIGTIHIAGTVDVAHSIAGSGPDACLKANSPGANESLLLIKNRQNITLRDFQIDGDGENAAVGERAHNIYIWSSSNIIVENIYSHTAQGDGVNIYSNPVGSPCRYVTVRGCRLTNRGRAGITITGYGANYVRIIDNDIDVGTVVSKTSVAHGAAIDAEPSANGLNPLDLKIKGNQCEWGIQVGHQDNSYWDGLEIEENTIRIPLTGWQGINATQVRNFRIANNRILGGGVGNQSGIYVRAYGAFTTKVGYGAIDGNLIRNIGDITLTTGHGISLESTSSDSAFLGMIAIQNNIIDSVNGCGIVVLEYIPHMVVTGNLIHVAGGYGISLNDAQRFGVVGNVVANCYAIGYLTQSITQGTEHGLMVGNGYFQDAAYGSAMLFNNNIDDVLCGVNNLASAANFASALAAWYNPLTVTNVHGVGNKEQPTTRPTDKTIYFSESVAFPGAYAEMYITQGATPQTLNATGDLAHFDVLDWSAGLDGDESILDADKANDTITIPPAGRYLVSFVCDFVSTPAATYEFMAYVSGAADTSLRGRVVAGAGATVRVEFLGIRNFAAGATLTVRAAANFNSAQIMPVNANLSVTYLKE